MTLRMRCKALVSIVFGASMCAKQREQVVVGKAEASAPCTTTWWLCHTSMFSCSAANHAAPVAGRSCCCWLQVAPDAPEIVAGIQRLAECLDKTERFGDRAASMSSGSPMSTATHTSGRM
jgi:hypothetical protein